MLKTYSFNLDRKKHEKLIKWIKKRQESGSLNLSAMIRRLLKEEMERGNAKEANNR